jgi:hypothetical protein
MMRGLAWVHEGLQEGRPKAYILAMARGAAAQLSSLRCPA